MPDVTACAEDGVIADSRAGLDHCVWLDRYAFSDLCAWINNRGWMDPRRKCDRLGRESQNNLLESLHWICNPNVSGSDRFSEIAWNKHCRRARLAQLNNVFSVCKEADFSRSRFRQ